MLKVLLLVLFYLNTSFSISYKFRNPVQARQFYDNRREWYPMKYTSQTISNRISYWVDVNFTKDEANYIKWQLNKLTSKTCLKLVEFAQGPIKVNDPSICTEKDACIHFWKKDDPSQCSSDLLTREITLSKYCFHDKWVLHEILHVLGFGHEHQRIDRDCYVEVIGDGLKDTEYTIDPTVDISFPYDVHSIMHYRVSDRLKPAKFAYVQNDVFGQWDELTWMDTMGLNYMFCGGKHYCETDPQRCQWFRCWIECNPCSNETLSQCRDCTHNTYG